jgi:uncharacterized protein (DUF433 family)
MNLPDFLREDQFGEITITGHRIPLYTIVRCYQEGMSAEQMAREFDTLQPELLTKIIGFYLENRGAVDAYAEGCRAEIERQAALPPGPGLVKMRRLTELLRRAEEKYGADPAWRALNLVDKIRRVQRESGAEAG